MQKTGAGILPVDIVRNKDDYRIVMMQRKVEVHDILPLSAQKTLLAASGINSADLIRQCPIAIASMGYYKVMVGIRGIEKLHGLRPHMDGLAALSGEIGCNGHYVFTLDPSASLMIHSRMFAPAIGIAEDPVTGNANGPRGAYLVQYGVAPHDGSRLVLDAVQGEAIGRVGAMMVRMAIGNGRPVKVKISGDAVIAFSAELVL